MSGAEEEAAAARGGGSGSESGGSGGGGRGGGGGGAGSSGSSGARRRFDDKGLVARTSLILWHTHQNDAGAVRKLLEEDAALVNARDYDSRTPLHVAALHGWHDVAECLIANGADVNAQDRWQNTVRHAVPLGPLSRDVCARWKWRACCVGVDWIWGRAAAWALFGMVYRNDPDWGFGLSYFWIFVRIGFGLFCDESMVSERKRSATVLSLQYAAFDSIGFWGSLWVGLELACLTNFEAYAVD